MKKKLRALMVQYKDSEAITMFEKDKKGLDILYFCDNLNIKIVVVDLVANNITMQVIGY